MLIAGFDEVGRGAWAGPLLVAAVVIDDVQFIGLKDSKKLSKAKHQSITRDILKNAIDIHLAWIDSRKIDEIGLAAALKHGFLQTSDHIQRADEYVVDGTVDYVANNSSVAVVKGDERIPAIAAASIIAKYYRDVFMAQLAFIYPQYGFDAHVGYGTSKHKSAIEHFGLIAHHRRSFKPVAAFE